MTEDGYFKSGDVGVMDARGYFKIVDRKKDMVLVSGFNVYPNEVEEVVADMPGVLECAVVGVPDEKTGEAVKLVIVKKDPAPHRSPGQGILQGQPHGLQAAQGDRVPHRTAQDPVAKSCAANCATKVTKGASCNEAHVASNVKRSAATSPACLFHRRGTSYGEAHVAQQRDRAPNPQRVFFPPGCFPAKAHVAQQP